MRAAVTQAVLVMMSAMAVEGCATRHWVNNVVARKEAQMGGRVSGEVGRLDYQLAGIHNRVVESRETAQWAQRRADEAYARADDANSRLNRWWTTRYQRELVETMHVQFGFGSAELDDRAQTALLTVIKELRDNPQLTCDLEGFTDATGARDYNIALSQRRVEAVRRFLVAHGADLSRLHSVGRGPLQAGAEEAARQRRVTVKLMLSAQ
jgi:outer membrane protein OmpA-like peptidoglycan-associated protein